MTVETIASAAAVATAGACALTDFLWGKVYNKVLVWAAVVAVAWLGFYGAWHAFGGATAMDAYPELGLWFGQEVPAPAPVDPEVLLGLKPAADAGKSVMPGPDDKPSAAAPQAAPAEPVTPTYAAYLGRVGVNVVIAFLIGFGMWWFGLWAAGDAKLFAVLAALVPLGAYVNAFWPVFPAYVLLFNTFLALMVLLVLELAVRFARQAIRPTPEEAEAWRNAWTWIRGNVGNLAIGFVGVVFLFLVIKTLRMLTRDLMAAYTSVTSSTLVYFLLFLVFHPLARAMRRPWVGWPIAIATAGFIVYVALYPTPDYNLASVLHVGALMLGLVVFLIVYELYLNVFDYKPIKLWELRPRMLLARKTQEVLKEDKDLLETKMGPVGPDGLSPQQVETLRRWWIDRGKGGRLWINRTIPFAPALFLGTLATVLFGGYILRMKA
jgi:Flp pilus assembly protein protease CpaA